MMALLAGLAVWSLLFAPLWWCCCGDTCVGSITVNVTGCNGLALVGATVTITLGGVTVASGTTDGSGQYVASGLGAGTYTVSVSASRHNSSTTTATISCPSSENPVVNVTLTASSGYVCCPGCPNPVKTQLFGSFGGVSFVFNYNVIFGELAGASSSGTLNGSDCDGTTDVRAILVVVLTCPQSPGDPWTLYLTVPGQCSLNQCHIYRGAGLQNCQWQDASTAGDCTLPTSLSFSAGTSYTLSGCAGACGPISLPSGTFAITE